jgi:hypothetical protein
MFAGAVLLAWSSPASAQFTTGNKLYEACQDNKKPTYIGCEAYILGVTDAQVMIFRKSPCLPQGVTATQILAVVRKYLSDHPAELHGPASELVLKSLENAFQCPW